MRSEICLIGTNFLTTKGEENVSEIDDHAMFLRITKLNGRYSLF